MSEAEEFSARPAIQLVCLFDTVLEVSITRSKKGIAGVVISFIATVVFEATSVH
jgi:hypothetical protein